jgi:predicted O-methyltransferase YrrM
VSPERAAAFAGEFIPEDEPLLDARRNARDLGGVTPVSPAAGATLRFIAATVAAKTMVEIGTGCGSSGIWLLRGARPDAVLTSVDSEPEHHRLARQAYGAAGFAANRYRLITGKAADVLPRLTDGAYDLVFCDADRQEYPDYLAAALRLLRPGGVAAFNDVWWDGRPPPPAHADPEEAAARQVCEQVRDDERLVPLLVPAGDGLLAAVRRTS